MKIFVSFDCLVTYECTYGKCLIEDGVVKIFIEKGLALKDSKFIDRGVVAEIVECEEGGAEDVFPVHYIYDPVKGVEYTEWKLVDGLLRARSNGGEWVEYKSKAESLHAMHEYVGGVWFVFEGVSFFGGALSKYTLDRKGFTGERFLREWGERDRASGNNYILEGVSNNEPGPGWVTMDIHADSFFLEFPSV